jgi:hypothetical protein
LTASLEATVWTARTGVLRAACCTETTGGASSTTLRDPRVVQALADELEAARQLLSSAVSVTKSARSAQMARTVRQKGQRQHAPRTDRHGQEVQPAAQLAAAPGGLDAATRLAAGPPLASAARRSRVLGRRPGVGPTTQGADGRSQCPPADLPAGAGCAESGHDRTHRQRRGQGDCWGRSDLASRRSAGRSGRGGTTSRRSGAGGRSRSRRAGGSESC